MSETIDDTHGILNIVTTALEVDENEVNEWLHTYDGDIGYQLLTDDEIVDTVKEAESDFASETASESDDEYDGAEYGEEIGPVTDPSTEAKMASQNLSEFIEWYEKQEDANFTDGMLLR